MHRMNFNYEFHLYLCMCISLLSIICNINFVCWRLNLSYTQKHIIFKACYALSVIMWLARCFYLVVLLHKRLAISNSIKATDMDEQVWKLLPIPKPIIKAQWLLHNILVEVIFYRVIQQCSISIFHISFCTIYFFYMLACIYVGISYMHLHLACSLCLLNCVQSSMFIYHQQIQKRFPQLCFQKTVTLKLLYRLVPLYIKEILKVDTYVTS